MIYEDHVSLIVTALDGRNAHLAEQVTAKSHVVMLSTQSSDPTLSRAYVPWYFRMVPDDLQQSEIFVKEIYVKRKFKIPFKNVGIWIVCPLGMVGTVLSFIIAFFPPAQFPNEHKSLYFTVLIVGVISIL